MAQLTEQTIVKGDRGALQVGMMYMLGTSRTIGCL